MMLIGLKENPGLFLLLECKSGGHNNESITVRYSLGWRVMWSMEDQESDHNCSMKIVCAKESRLTQKGVHPKIESFEYMRDGTRLEGETGSMKRNSDVT